MAETGRSLLVRPSSTPISHVSDLLDETRLPRSLFRIHKKQQELLDQANSWAQYLSRQPKPGVNLPLEVLENLRNFHRRQTELLNEQCLKAPDRTEPEASPQDDRAGSQSPRLVGASSHEEADDEEDLGTQIPWSSSPVRITAASPLHESGQAQSPSPAPNTEEDHETAAQEPFMSQVFVRPSLRPTIDAANAQRKPVFNDFPSSSLGADEELEIVPPAVFTEAPVLISRAAGLNPTPPSAQIQVPCTFDTNSSIPEGKPNAAISQPYKELASLQKVQERVALKKSRAAEARRMPLPYAKSHMVDIPDSQSSVDSTSSVIPATNFARPNRSPVKPQKMQLVKSTVEETPYINRRSVMPPPDDESSKRLNGSTTEESQEAFKRQTPDYRPISPLLRVSSPVAKQAPQASDEVLPRSPPPAVDAPFLRYSVAYPSYKGSLRDFVAACLCIPKRRLANYQYDDFIRAWPESYVPYVITIEPTETPLVAIDWYIDTVEELPLLYQEKIVTKENLKSILDFYQGEVKLIRESADQKRSRTRSPVSIPVSVSTPVPMPASPAQEAKSQGQELAILHSVETDTISPLPQYEVRAPASRSPNRRQQSSPQVLPAGEEEDLPDHSRPDAPTLPRKRCPNDDEVAGPVPKRLALSALIQSEANAVSNRSIISSDVTAPSTSDLPRSTGPLLKSKKEKKEKQKFEKSRAGWQAYLDARHRRKKLSDNISISSSAPISATPALNKNKG